MSSATNKSHPPSLREGDDEYASTFYLGRSSLSGAFKGAKAPKSITCQNQLHARHHEALVRDFCNGLRGHTINTAQDLTKASEDVASQLSNRSTRLRVEKRSVDSLTGSDNTLPSAGLTLQVTDNEFDAGLCLENAAKSARKWGSSLRRNVLHPRSSDGK
jgi:hypothetical protein